MLLLVKGRSLHENLWSTGWKISQSQIYTNKSYKKLNQVHIKIMAPRPTQLQKRNLVHDRVIVRLGRWATHENPITHSITLTRGGILTVWRNFHFKKLFLLSTPPLLVCIALLLFFVLLFIRSSKHHRERRILKNISHFPLILTNPYYIHRQSSYTSKLIDKKPTLSKQITSNLFSLVICFLYRKLNFIRGWVLIQFPVFCPTLQDCLCKNTACWN